MNGELIRLANRDRLNSTEVASLIEFSGEMLAFRTVDEADSDTLVASALFETWKVSFDEPQATA